MALREVVKWIVKREAWLEKNSIKPARQPVKFDIAHDPDNADAALLLLGIVKLNPLSDQLNKERAQLLLEPWAVQAAFRRRRGSQRVSAAERSEIRRCTRDPDSLRWPRSSGE